MLKLTRMCLPTNCVEKILPACLPNVLFCFLCHLFFLALFPLLCLFFWYYALQYCRMHPALRVPSLGMADSPGLLL